MSAPVPHSRPSLGEAEAEAARRVVLSGHLAQGSEVEAFEREVAALTGRARAVAVSSGTAALHLALLALEVGEGDEVLLPSYVCTALLHAVRACGALPVICDIDAQTRNMDPDQARERLSPRTKALVLPHMFGLPAPVEAFAGLGPPVIEDCAMCLGTGRGGRPVGGLGTLSICSFYATKLVACGEGGMVLCDDPALEERVRGLRQYDGLPAERLRFNAKMTDVQAAIGRVQLGRLGEFVARRRALAALYDGRFAGLPLKRPLESPEHIYYRYVISAGAPAGQVIARLQELGISARRPVHSPLHVQAGLPDAQCPRASGAHLEDVSLPLYPGLDEAAAERVMAAVERIATQSP